MRPLDIASMIDLQLAAMRAACYLRSTTGFGDLADRAEIVECHGGRVVVVLSAEATTALQWMHPTSAALMVEAIYSAHAEGELRGERLARAQAAA